MGGEQVGWEVMEATLGSDRWWNGWDHERHEGYEMTIGYEGMVGRFVEWGGWGWGTLIFADLR